jgi:HEAT repeat protein
LDKVGTNAIPTLLWMLRQRDSEIKRKVMELLQRQRFIKFNHISAEQQNGAAYPAFLRLNARAEAAVPSLIEIYQQKISPASQQCAAQSLGVIGLAAKRAIPTLIRDLGNPNTQVQVRCSILLALAHFQAEPELVVPALTNALSDSDALVRVSACTAFWYMGVLETNRGSGSANPGLRQAVPALVHSLSDADAGVRRGATNALQVIDPDAVPQAGVP